MISEISEEKLPQQTTFHPNLFLITSGPVPPNPAELLLQEKMGTLFGYLKENFDYVIVDTPPVGLVTDAILAAKYADACIYVVRQRFTFKDQIPIINDLEVNAKISNISVLINDVAVTGHYGYSYRYGYGYGYGYGYNNKSDSYYSSQEKPSWFSKFTKRK